ncbi:hypothetical protein B7939_00615 [Eggerthia catenaformis]|nr:hypothetical protein B7939_00615 [Eggerthia catenaformis]
MQDAFKRNKKMRNKEYCYFDEFNIFDFDNSKPYRIEKPIRLIELFAGYGSQAMAIKKLCQQFNHPYELYKISEWEINAVKSYKALHTSDDKDYTSGLTKDDIVNQLIKWGISIDGKNLYPKNKIEKRTLNWLKRVYNSFISTNNIGSITSIHASDLEIKDTNKYEYIMTYSFPCQDLSSIGLKQGMSKEKQTRSGLLWEVERLLDECIELPQILIMENVTQVHNFKNKHDFDKWCNKLTDLGYINFWKDMNASDYGIPQSRNRTIMISILNADYGSYRFEKPTQLKMILEDILEKNVDEKYYLSEKMLDCFLEISRRNKNSSFHRYEKFMRNFNDDRKIISSTITTRTSGRVKAQYISNKSNEETRKYLNERKRRKENKNKIINTT